MTAAELYRGGRTDLPPLQTISGVYADLPCDESPYIRAVAARVPFPSNVFCPLSEPLTAGLSEEHWQVDAPFGDIQRGTFTRCAAILSGFGARSLLTGYGGDELVHEAFYLWDLAQRKRFFLLLRDSWIGSKSSHNSFWWLFSDALRRAAPSVVRRTYRRIRKAKPWQPPDWANPDFVDYFRQCPNGGGPPLLGFRSVTQEKAFHYLNDAGMSWALQLPECKGSYYGYEVRHPFLDRPLVEFVLAIPFEHRITNGQWKYLLRGSLASVLPGEILNRPMK